MSEQNVEYTHELVDFPDAQELRDITTSKEELFKSKKRNFITSLGGDITSRAKNQGEYMYSATLANNLFGLNETEQKRLLDEVSDFLSKQGYNVEIKEVDGGAKTFKIDWSTTNV